MIISRDFVLGVRKRLLEDTNLDTAALAQELSMPEAYVIMAFPVPMRMRGDSQALDALWQDLLTAGGDVANLSQSILERIGTQKVHFIWFVAQSFRRELKLFNEAGNLLGGIPFHTSRINGGNATEYFVALREKYGILAKPPKRGCSKGCGGRSCGWLNPIISCGANKKRMCA